MNILLLVQRHRFFVVALTFALYLASSIFLYQIMGPGAGAMTVVPVMLTAFLCEGINAFFVWFLCLFSSTLLLNANGYTGWTALLDHGGMPGMVMLLIMAGTTSKMQSVRVQFQQELQQRGKTERELQERNRELEALQQASLQLTSSLELQPILEIILQNAQKLVHADDVHVFLYENHELTFGAAIWEDQHQQQPFSQPRSGGLTHTVAVNGTPMFIPAVNSDPLYQDWQWGGAIAALPLQINKQMLGVMNIAFNQPHVFKENEVRILQLFADQAALAIQNARMYRLVQNDVINLEEYVVERTVELMHAKERAEAVLNNSFDAISLFNQQTGIEQVNPAFLNLFGYSEHEEVLHLPITHFVHPETRDTFATILDTVIISQLPARQEFVLQDHTGKKIDADVALTPVQMQDNPTIICTIRDITDRKKAESRQQEMTRNLRTVLAVANDLIACPDLDTTLREAVEALRGRIGVERCAIFIEHGDYLQGTYGTDSQGLTTDEHNLYIPIEEAWLDKYQRLNSHEAQWISKQSKHMEWDGSTHHVVGEGWVGITRIQSPDGFRAILFNDAGISKTPLNETLQEVVVIFCTLLGKIIERRQFEENIQRALDKETELSKLKTHFITTISHEFRTPLSIILSSSQMSRLYYDRMNEDRRKEHLQRIEDQVHHMVRLLENVLTISHANKVGFVCNPTPINVISVCANILDEIMLTSTSNHKLVFTHCVPDDEYLLDEKLLRTIIMNLMTNALKYSPPSSQIYVDIQCQDENIILSIRDEGMGIMEKDLKYLFQEFFRAENTTSIPGTGLGLSIVKRAVEAHAGCIEVESEPGSTTFTVTLRQNTPSLA